MSTLPNFSQTLPEPSEKNPVQVRLEFARHNFDNLQNLIRFIDTKAAGLITIVIFLAASGIQVAKDAITSLNFYSSGSNLLNLLFLGGCFGFLISFTWISIFVQRVMMPRGTRNHAEAERGRDLMWQDHVIHHGSQAAYAHAVQSASAETLLHNVTDQIFELSHISKDKMDAFQQARIGFWPAFCSWLLTIASSILLMRWK